MACVFGETYKCHHFQSAFTDWPRRRDGRYIYGIMTINRLLASLLDGASRCKRRHRRLSLYFSGRSIFFFWCDCSATAGRIFTKSSSKDVFAALFVHRTSMKIGPPQFFCGRSRRPFSGAKIQTVLFSDGCCAETRRNSGKTKTNGTTTISRLPSHLRLVKFGSGHMSYISCAFWPMAHSASLHRQYLENGNTYRVISRSL